MDIFGSGTDLDLVVQVLFVGMILFKTSLRFYRFKLDLDKTIILQVNTHRLTESYFEFDVTLSRWQPWRHFMQKSAAIWWMHTCCPLTAHCQFCLQFLIHSTFVHVVMSGCRKELASGLPLHHCSLEFQSHLLVTSFILGKIYYIVMHKLNYAR